MIEGLWVVRFLTPDNPNMDLSGGVVVIETGRVFGGDSGYYYVGNLEQFTNGKAWKLNIKITRHDPNIESIFGDDDEFALSGSLEEFQPDDHGRKRMFASLDHQDGLNMTALLVKASDLP